MSKREELILEVAEFLASERSDYYYFRDVLAAFPIGETEYEIAAEWAERIKRGEQI